MRGRGVRRGGKGGEERGKTGGGCGVDEKRKVCFIGFGGWTSLGTALAVSAKYDLAPMLLSLAVVGLVVFSLSPKVVVASMLP